MSKERWHSNATYARGASVRPASRTALMLPLHMKKTDYLIVGNSAAAIAGVEGIRSHDQKGPLLLVSDEPYHTYSRPLIGDYLSGKRSFSQMMYRPRDFYARSGVEALLGRKILHVEPEEHSAILDDNSTVRFRKALISTGGKPFSPSFNGKDLPGIFYFTTLDDAKAIRTFVRKGQRACILGGGLIALKAAEALLTIGVRVTIVELADRILSTALDKKASKIASSLLRKMGVEIRTSDTVIEAVGGNGMLLGVNLKSGLNLHADLLVIATGVLPSASIVDSTSISIGKGIVIDERCRTTSEAVFAAGDVSEGKDALLGTKRPIPIWPSAYLQGYAAGCNMAGRERSVKGAMAMNSFEIGGTAFMSIGLPDGPALPAGRSPSAGVGLSAVEGTCMLERCSFKENRYRKMVLAGRKLVGAVLVGSVERAGILTRLIRDGIDIWTSRRALLKEDFGFSSLPLALRREILDEKRHTEN